MHRREFMKTVAATGGAAALNPIRALGSRQQDSAGKFGVHEFIENNPNAVFIMRTNVDKKTNGDAIKQAALEFSRSVFVPREDGVPLTHLVPIKPNLTCRARGSSKYTVERSMGIVTDAYFVEGVIEGMKELGLSGSQFFIREVNCPDDFEDGGYWAMAERTGADLRDMSPKVGVISEDDLVWKDVPDGVWFKKIPYLWPINAENTFLLNIAKFKAHGMGLTLCCKNLQGSIAHNYQQHCTGLRMDISADHKNPDARTIIEANHARHLEAGVPRWDKPNTKLGDITWNSGVGMEMWGSRCLDNNSITKAGLHIIEGIYGRDGNFMDGPYMDDGTVDLNSKKGVAKDFMTNVIIFGKNQYNVDIIGLWLGGHEPGNFGLYHMAIDRGLNEYLNPFSIPVYEWKNGEAVLTPLTEFERTPLLTYYLQRDYGGQSENYWHLVDEPFDYASVDVADRGENVKPGAFVLHQNRPNPFNPYTSIEYDIPRGGYARLEVYNSSGQLVEVLVDDYRPQGSHMAVWNTNGHSSGLYYYRFIFEGYSETKKMMLLK